MLSKPLNIDLYNETWFDKPPRTSEQLFDYNHPTLAFPEPQLIPFTSLSDLHAKTESIYPSPLIENPILIFFLRPFHLFYLNRCLHLMVYSSFTTT